jgi:hypothetical protein
LEIKNKYHGMFEFKMNNNGTIYDKKSLFLYIKFKRYGKFDDFEIKVNTFILMFCIRLIINCLR